jgi:hypothetical protein
MARTMRSACGQRENSQTPRSGKPPYPKLTHVVEEKRKGGRSGENEQRTVLRNVSQPKVELSEQLLRQFDVRTGRKPPLDLLFLVPRRLRRLPESDTDQVSLGVNRFVHLLVRMFERFRHSLDPAGDVILFRDFGEDETGDGGRGEGAAL